MIKISYFNEIYCQIEANTYEKNQLVRLFNIKEPGYYFKPAYKQGYWNGCRSVYDGSNYIYIGLVPFIEKFCKIKNIPIDIQIDDFNPNNSIDLDDFNTFIESLDLPKPLRQYQKDSIFNCVSNKKTVVVSPTSSGKSLIIYCVARFIENKIRDNKKILIIVPSKILVKQMYDDFKEYSVNDSWNVEEHCSRISSDYQKDFTKKIIITTYQSMINNDLEFFKHFEGVLLDECHGAQSYGDKKAKCLHQILNKCVNSRYRFGFTGTFPDDELFKITLLKYFCKKHVATDYEELLKNNWISNFTVNEIKLNYLVNRNGQTYRDELNYIYESDYRNEFLTNLLIKNKNNQLLLFKEVTKHALKLYHLFNSDPRLNDRQIIILDGDSNAKERENVKKLIESNNNIILLATYKLLGTGWSVNNLHHVIFAAPLKSKQPIIQSIGRGLRLLNSEKNCQIWDIIDKFLYNNVLNKQGILRDEHYKEAKFKINRVEINDFKLSKNITADDLF